MRLYPPSICIHAQVWLLPLFEHEDVLERLPFAANDDLLSPFPKPQRPATPTDIPHEASGSAPLMASPSAPTVPQNASHPSKNASHPSHLSPNAEASRSAPDVAPLAQGNASYIVPLAKGNTSYIVPAAGNFDACHPFIQHRRHAQLPAGAPHMYIDM